MRPITLDTPALGRGEIYPEVREHILRESLNFNRCLDSWVNAKLGQLVLAWGAPHSTGKIPDGTSYSVWEEKEGDKQCRTTVFSKSGKISSWRATGNDCMRQIGPSKLE